MLQQSPAAQLLEAVKKHIGNVAVAFAEGKISQAFGQASAAWHEANSVRWIIKEFAL